MLLAWKSFSTPDIPMNSSKHKIDGEAANAIIFVQGTSVPFSNSQSRVNSKALLSFCAGARGVTLGPVQASVCVGVQAGRQSCRADAHTPRSRVKARCRT